MFGLLDGFFRSYATYIAGFDAGARGALLQGFREWLIPRCDGGNNLAWPVLILWLAFPEGEIASYYNSPDASREQTAVTTLFESLDTFLAARDDHRDGFQRIYAEYTHWLDQQKWPQPSSPQQEQT